MPTIKGRCAGLYKGSLPINTLAMVVTDRISAFDVVLPEPIPI